MARSESCKLECLGEPSLYDDPNSMWPPEVTEAGLHMACDDWGELFTEKAPARLDAAGDCPMRALRSISKGATFNPAKALANARIRHSLGIESEPTDRIIY